MRFESGVYRAAVRGGLLLTALFSGGAALEAQTQSVLLWNGGTAESVGAEMNKAVVGTWGNGEFSNAPDVQYEGNGSLKVVTRNPLEGIRFDLKTPLDLTPYLENGYIRLRLHFRDSKIAVAPPAFDRGRGFRGGEFGPDDDEGNEPGGGFGQRAPGFGGGTVEPLFEPLFQIAPLPGIGAISRRPDIPGMEDEFGYEAPVPTGPVPQETAVEQLFCTLELENGVMQGVVSVPKTGRDEHQVDFDRVKPDDDGWLLFSIPIGEMQSTPGASGALKRLILSSDRQDSFWLTQTALIVETGEIQVSIRQASQPPGTQQADITVRPGTVVLIADVEAGTADPSVEWNFNADNAPSLAPPQPQFQPIDPALGADRAGIAPPDEQQQFGQFGQPGMMVPAGPRVDARGLVASFEYPNEEQNYRVEVTVRDRAGKKAPATSSILVRVRG